eukprot:COSAG02_NODE_7229_length_3108_cov_2.800598_2_plen_203_part_00
MLAFSLICTYMLRGMHCHHLTLACNAFRLARHNGDVVVAKVDRFEGEKVVCKFPDGKYYFAGQTVSEAAEAQRKALAKQDEDDAKLMAATEASGAAETVTNESHSGVQGAVVVAAEGGRGVWVGGKQCVHGLKMFHVPKQNFRCDVCGARILVGSAAFGCRRCNADVCASCNSKLPQSESISTETRRLSPMEERMMQMGMGR